MTNKPLRKFPSLNKYNKTKLTSLVKTLSEQMQLFATDNSPLVWFWEHGKNFTNPQEKSVVNKVLLKLLLECKTWEAVLVIGNKEVNEITLNPYYFYLDDILTSELPFVLKDLTEQQCNDETLGYVLYVFPGGNVNLEQIEEIIVTQIRNSKYFNDKSLTLPTLTHFHIKEINDERLHQTH